MRNAAWEVKRQQVIARALGICERCHERRGKHVHHLVYGGRKRGTEPLEWLQLVCLQCHGAYHPHHKFRSVADQKRVAAQRKRRRAWKASQPEASCFHCGGAYSRKKHKAICVKYGLHLAGQPRPLDNPTGPTMFDPVTILHPEGCPE